MAFFQNIFGAALPSAKELAWSIFPSSKADYRPWKANPQSEVFAFSKSRFALKALVEFKLQHTQAALNLYIPELICSSFVQPLEEYRQKGQLVIHYYPLKDLCSPDLEQLKTLWKKDQPHLFLIVHYFGHLTPLSKLKKLVEKNKGQLIEDCAHCLRPVGEIGQKGHYALYSPYKFLALPDGALLVANPKLPQLQDLKKSLQRTGKIAPSPWKFLFKKIFQKILGLSFHPQLPHADDPPSLTTPNQPHISWLAQNLLSRVTTDHLEQISSKRFEHGDALTNVAQMISPQASLLPFQGHHLAIVLEGAKSYTTWQKHRLLPATWPDLPKEVQSPFALQFRKSTFIHIPFHSNNYQKALKSITDGKQSELFRESPIQVTQINDKKEWEALFSKMPRANLLQKWEYGQAKGRTQRLHVQRLAFNHLGQCVAVAQVQTRRWGRLKLRQINRGPIFLSERPHMALIKETFKAINRFFPLKKGNLVVMAPEIENTPSHKTLLKWNHSIPLGRQWSSTTLDLTQDLDQLRANLNQKWRNRLNKVSKEGLQVKMATGAECLDLILKINSLNQAEKNFEGLNNTFLQQYVAQLGNPEELLAFYIQEKIEEQEEQEEQEEVMACITVSLHAQSASYLLGHANHQARKLNAKNLLLWEATTHLKQRGLTVFDLGGLGKSTPQINHFKKGMGGPVYQLVGVWIN